MKSFLLYLLYRDILSWWLYFMLLRYFIRYNLSYSLHTLLIFELIKRIIDKIIQLSAHCLWMVWFFSNIEYRQFIFLYNNFLLLTFLYFLLSINFIFVLFKNIYYFSKIKFLFFIVHLFFRFHIIVKFIILARAIDFDLVNILKVPAQTLICQLITKLKLLHRL